MQSGGNFALNKASSLMNTDDADLCVYHKVTNREGGNYEGEKGC